MWVRVQTTGEQPGIISSRRNEDARGFHFGYTNVDLE